MSDSTSVIIKSDPDDEPTGPTFLTAIHFSIIQSAVSPSGTHQVFLPFKRLPQEIRDMVWGFAACEPRRVELDYFPVAACYYFEMCDLVYKAVVPGLMHACQESRAVEGRFYERVESNSSYLLGETYVNWDADIAILSRSLLIKFSRVTGPRPWRNGSFGIEARDQGPYEEIYPTWFFWDR